MHHDQHPDIATAATVTTATNLAITLATATATATATVARTEMNNWDDAEIRGVAGCVLLCQHAVLVKPKNCNGEPALVGMKEYIGEGLGHDCFLQGRGVNNGPTDGENGDNKEDRDGDGCEGRKPIALG